METKKIESTKIEPLAKPATLQTKTALKAGLTAVKAPVRTQKCW
jgi:hypothetical protein